MLSKQAANMQIAVHEWPLPSGEGYARAAVFALCVPAVFALWRDATYVIRAYLCNHRAIYDSELRLLRQMPMLHDYSSGIESRLQLASRHHLFSKSHYKEQSVAKATTESILVNHGATYILADSCKSAIASVMSEPLVVRALCTPQLGQKLECIQSYIADTRHTSNEVLCRKDEGQGHISEREYIAYGHMRAGPRLQWPNILRQLVSASMDLRKEESELFVTQSIWQLQEESLDVHHEAYQPDFRRQLSQALNEVVSAHEENWQAASVMRICTYVALRLLDLRQDLEDSTDLLSVLNRCRACIDRWIVILRSHLCSTASEDEETMRSQIFQLAIDQACTLDLPIELFDRILATDCQAVTFFFKGLILARDYRPLGLFDASSSASSVRLAHRICRLVQRYRTRVENYILNDGTGLNLAINDVWKCRVNIEKWGLCRSGWMSATDEPFTSKGHSRSVIHFDILTGELRRNGRHLSRLPAEYEDHSTYIRLLGSRAIEVAVSEDSRFEYSSRELLKGRRLFFKLQDDVLTIMVSCNEDELFLVPVEALQSYLPRALVEPFVHFYCPANRTTFFRRLENAFEDGVAEWSIERGEPLSEIFHVQSGEWGVSSVLGPILLGWLDVCFEHWILPRTSLCLRKTKLSTYGSRDLSCASRCAMESRPLSRTTGLGCKWIPIKNA